MALQDDAGPEEEKATALIQRSNAFALSTITQPRQRQSRHPMPRPTASLFGLIQESIAHDLYFLILQAMLWNQKSPADRGASAEDEGD